MGDAAVAWFKFLGKCHYCTLLLK